MAKITLNFWIMQEFGDFHRKVIGNIIEDFKKDHPNIEIQITDIAWRFAWDKIMVFTKKKQGPDLMQIGNTWNGALAYVGALRDITEYVSRLGGLKLFTPASQRLCEFPETNKISSIPWFVDARAYYYRKDIFDKFGFTTKDLDNWALLEKVCEKINGVEINGKKIWALGIPGQKDPALVHNIAPWIWGAGGDFLGPDNTKAAFNSEIALKGIEFFFDLIATKNYTPWPAITQNYDAFVNNFASLGDYAIVYSGPWILTSYLDPTSPLYSLVAPHIYSALTPAGPTGRYTFCGGSNLAIGAFSKYPDESWELAKFFLSNSVQEIYTKQTNELPALNACYEAKTLADTSKAKIFKESVKYGRCFPNSISWGPIELVISEHLANIFRSIREKRYSVQLLNNELNLAAQRVNDIILRKII